MDRHAQGTTAGAPHREPGRRYAVGVVKRQVRTHRPPAGAPPQHISVPKTEQPDAPQEKKYLDFIKQSKRRPATTKPALPRQKRSLVLRRQMVERAQAYKKQTKIVKRKHLVRYTLELSVFAALAVVAWSFQGLLPLSVNWFEQSAPSSTVTATRSEAENTPLDENAVSSADLAAHRMADDEPRILKVPRLNVESRIKRVGRSLNGEPISPSNIFDVGWFDASSKPGKEGAILLNGHSLGQREKGVFYQLSMLTAGDEVTIERGDGSTVTYLVERVQTYTSADLDMGVAMKPVAPPKNGLNIMTAPIRYDGRPDSTKKRTVVFAVEERSSPRP